MSQASKDATTPAWTALRAHHAEIAPTHMRELFVGDPERIRRLRLEACGLFLDYSRHRVTDDSLSLLQAVASEAGVGEAVRRLFAGDPVNNTEGRPALHAALRHLGDDPFPDNGRDVMPEVRAERLKMRAFCERLRGGRLRGVTERPLTTVVAIGIGGSHLGPAMACRALSCAGDPALTVHFVSNLDGAALEDVLERCSAEETLFIVTSKTFGTEETLTNARSARAWLKRRLGDEPAVDARHLFAVTAHAGRTAGLGIPPENVFAIWDWVGGRYSLWSAVGLPLAILIGMDGFEEFLAGAAEMDAHFRTAPPSANMPVLLGLLEVWYRNLFGAATRAVIPYDHALSLLPAYLQQLEMESNGKSVDREGRPITHGTAPVVWGATGSEGQHAFFQLLHQGGTLIPADFIVPLESQKPLRGHQAPLLSNALAQATALMRGRTAGEAAELIESQGLEGEELAAQASHRVMPGNQPVSLLVYEQLDPRTLGALIALYEHKVYVESVIWNVNPFDQWGVELGKTLAARVRPNMEKAIAEGKRPGTSFGERVSRILDACPPDIT
ncbi:MAG: glucose-6-phosphate isomerase [Gammaproteobacteria bacterium]|nr:glucose-6-phosphate isomerase [Gammaproteobacteria bacterium]